MNTFLKILFLVIVCSSFIPNEKTKVYLIPGQGSDERIFSKISFSDKYEVIPIKYEMPLKHETMAAYAKRLSVQIKEQEGFILIGISLGGMLATEIAEIKNPKQVIVISSAKNANELPDRYSFQRRWPVYKIVGPNLSKLGAQILQPIVERDRNKEKETFRAMLAAKDPLFLKRTIQMIVTWERTTNSNKIIHIHGTKDHTIPIRNVSYTHLIEGGSHMMALTRADEISKILEGVMGE